MEKNSQQILLPVKVITKAKNNKIIGWQGEFLKIQINTSPVKGKANDQLINLLADYLDLPKKQITIVRGNTTKTKYIDLPKDSLVRLQKTIF